MLLVGQACDRSERGATGRHARPREILRNGIYAVLNEADDPDSARVPGRNQIVLPYDRKYIAAGAEEPLTYVAIDTTSWVPLILGKPPEAERGGTGRALISVTLADAYAEELERFTARHLDGPAAILLEGEVVSVHKIRAVIREGRLQITRCDEKDCELLLSRLAR